jgi:hypothetical protein
MKNYTKSCHLIYSTVQYSIDCLNSVYISKSLISRRQIFYYQFTLKESCLFCELLIRITEKLSIKKPFYLIQKLLNYNKSVIKLLKDQRFILLKSLNNIFDLSVPIFYYYGSLQLNLIKKLTNPSISCEDSKLNILKSKAITNYI